MKTLTVRWQRLVDARGETCPRCKTTGGEVARAVKTLSRRLPGVRVRAVSRTLSKAAFTRDPASSNRVWVAGRPLESWLGARTGASRCCGACGPTECRTVRVGRRTYDAVPARLIVKAGLRAAA
ncbi:MAG: ribonuclease D [Elusimicrobia bacterium]|nr:MAG: ribonuclease D [Elusimicrobiota bacterium]